MNINPRATAFAIVPLLILAGLAAACGNNDASFGAELRIVLEADLSQVPDIDAGEALKSAADIIHRRVDAYGATAKVRQEGANRLSVDLAGIEAAEGNNILDSATAREPLLVGESGSFPFHKGAHVIMVLQLFAAADESGIHGDAPYCLITGFIGSAKEWLVFEPLWEQVLKEAGVDSFHSKQFFGRDDEGRRLGPYEGWTDEKALAFLEKLCGIIDRRRLHPIGCAVDVSAFNALTEGERRWLTGGLYAVQENNQSRGRWRDNTGAPTKPYYLAFQNLLVQAAQRSRNDAQISFLFDQQNVLQAQAIQMFQQTVERGLMGGHERQLRWIVYGNSQQEPSLQAADLHTHAWYSFLVRGERLSRERVYAMDMLTKKRKVMGICSAEYMEFLLSNLPAHVRAQLRELA